MRGKFPFSTSSSEYDIYVIFSKHKNNAISRRYGIYVIWFESKGAAGA